MYEKQQVNLEERKKHANTKANKLKKSLKDVRSSLHTFMQGDADTYSWLGSKIKG